MSDSSVLLGKIRELRQRLSQVQGLVGEASKTASALLGSEVGDDAPLEERIAEGARRAALLDSSIRQLTDESNAKEIRPTRLIEKVRQQLERGRQLVGRLRTLAEEPLISRGDPIVGTDADDPLLHAYRETAAMTESTLRLVQAFPDAPSSQMRLSDGLENIINAIADRIAGLHEAVAFRKGELLRRDALALFLRKLADGDASDPLDFVGLADFLLKEARDSRPLHFLHAPPAHRDQFIACHALTSARIVARMIRHDPDWQQYAHDAVVAVLLKDVGMLAIDPAIVAASEPLDDEQKRALESHCRIGSELVAKHLPATATLYEAIAGHHERLDGTGYPAGLIGPQIGSLPRLLAVADVYAAMCCPRPQRPAFDPRTALTETLLMAERGLLDGDVAARLLGLSFYPVGSVVEMADGAVGVVVASHMAPRRIAHAGQTGGRGVGRSGGASSSGPAAFRLGRMRGPLDRADAHRRSAPASLGPALSGTGLDQMRSNADDAITQIFTDQKN